MSENQNIQFRISPTQQQELNALNKTHKLVASDDTLTQSHTIRWALSLTHNHLINPDPNKLTAIDYAVKISKIIRDPDLEPKTVIEAIGFILKQEEQDLTTKNSESV